MESAGLTKEAILKAFQALSDELGSLNTKGELCLFGGTVMVLAFSARVATKDVAAIFQPTRILREAAARVADANQLPPDWLNDGVKGFISTQPQTIEGNLPQYPNLRLVMPTPEYLLAMKCMASRIDTLQRDGGDVRDIIFLIRHLKLANPGDVMNIIANYYPANQIPVKAQYLVESLFEEGRI